MQKKQNTNKIKNKQLYKRTYKNKQYGGGNNALFNNTNLTSLEILNENTTIKYHKLFYKKSMELVSSNAFNKVKELFEKFYSGENQKKFTPYANLKIPFITEVQDMDDFTTDYYYKWYESKNPTFGNIISYDGENEPTQVIDFDTTFQITDKDGIEREYPIYEPLIVQICRDICLIINAKKYITDKEGSRSSLGIVNFKKYDGELETKLLQLLELCNYCIASQYKYLDVCLIFIKFIEILSKNLNIIGAVEVDSFNISVTDFFEDIFNQPFIFFPTHQQLSYQSIVLLITAPIINFRLTNRYRVIHTIFKSPKGDYNHNVRNHAINSHHFKSQQGTSELFKLWFSSMCAFIKILSEFFFIHPSQPKETPETIDDMIKNKTIFAFVLFAFLHEDQTILMKLLHEILKPNPHIVINPNTDAIYRMNIVANSDNLYKIYPMSLYLKSKERILLYFLEKITEKKFEIKVPAKNLYKTYEKLTKKTIEKNNKLTN